MNGVIGAGIQRQFPGSLFITLGKIGKQPFIGEIQRVGLRPVVVDDFLKPLHDGLVMYRNGKFPSAIEAARCQIDGPDQGAAIGQHHLAVQF